MAEGLAEQRCLVLGGQKVEQGRASERKGEESNRASQSHLDTLRRLLYRPQAASKAAI